jgi:hypothetical protein
MDLRATLGISREAGIGALVAVVALLVLVAGRLFRRSRMRERVWLDLSRRASPIKAASAR